MIQRRQLLALTTLIAPQLLVRAENLSYEDLAEYGISPDIYNDEIKATESPMDFGGLPSSGEEAQLWTDATVFEWEKADDGSDSAASLTSLDFKPYHVCNESQNSGTNLLEIKEAFEATDVDASHYYIGVVPIVNSEDLTCVSVRTVAGVVSKVYDATLSAADWMTVQPALPSIKMLAGTVENMQRVLDGESADDVLSIQPVDPPLQNSNTIEKHVLGLRAVMCPGVRTFERTIVEDDDILDDIKSFMIDGGGVPVADASFYYHRVAAKQDGVNAVTTERIRFWSKAIDAVVNMTDSVDGSNACLDRVIDEGMKYELDSVTVDITSESYIEDLLAVEADHGMSSEETESCVWYMMMGLALNPTICHLETQGFVKTLCKDGSSDLTKCTGGETQPDSGAISLSSFISGRGRAEALWNGAFVASTFAILVSALF